MQFRHSAAIWTDHPELVPGVLHNHGITGDISVSDRLAPFFARAAARLAGGSESELPEIQAWRRTFSRMGLKPTQYRCASEALLRRFRQEGSLPRIHPLIDLCNAVSVAFAIPIAVFDLAAVEGDLEVRHAVGDERYLTFAGTLEHPDPGEVVFADSAGVAHARRWTNRQSGASAVRAETATVLIVAEALHATAAEDVRDLVAMLAEGLREVWGAEPAKAILSAASPCFQA